MLRSAAGEANGTSQLAAVGDLDQPDTGVLLVLSAETAVERAAVSRVSARLIRLAARREEDLPATPIPIDVVGEQHALRAVLWAALVEVGAAVLEDDLPVDPPQARGAERSGQIVELIRTRVIWHRWWSPFVIARATGRSSITSTWFGSRSSRNAIR